MGETQHALDKKAESLKPSVRLLIVLLVLATFITYLAVGVYYVTGPMSPFHGLRLNASGQSFLAAFPGWNNREEFDDAAYNRAAVEILNTGVPRDHTGSLFFYAPVYAYFVAGCYRIGGLRLLSVAIPQAILAALSCGLLAASAYSIARRNAINSSLISGVLFLINARFAMYVGYISPTILLIFLFSVSIFAASRTATAGSLSLLVISILLAIGTQAGFFFVALGVAIWLLIQFFKTKTTGQLIAAVIILGVASAKNALPILLHQDSAGSINEIGRAVLWEANNPYYEGMGLLSLWERRPGNPWTHWQMSQREHERHENYLNRADHRALQAALLWIKENPGQYTKLVFVRFWTTLGPFTGMMSPRNRLISFCIWLLILPAGICGWWLYRQLPFSGFALAVAVSILLSSAFVIVEWYLRYRVPLDLLLTAYAGIGYSSFAFSFRKIPNKSIGAQPKSDGVAR